MIRLSIKKIQKLLTSPIREIKRIADFWSESKAGTYGSSVAYYAIFSFAPILVIAISITSLFVDSASARRSIMAEFTNVFGSNGANLVDSILKANVSDSTSITATIIGFTIVLLGAVGIFSELQSALDTIFETLPVKGKEGMWATIKKKLLSFGMVLSVGFLLLVSLALSTIITFVSGKFGSLIPGAGALGTTAEIVASLILVSFFLSLMYKILPSHRIRWKPALAGGLIAGTLFMVSKYALGLYLTSSSSFDSYGAASALVLLVIWTYYMAQVFFFSAVITRLYIVPKVR